MSSIDAILGQFDVRGTVTEYAQKTHQSVEGAFKEILQEGPAVLLAAKEDARQREQTLIAMVAHNPDLEYCLTSSGIKKVEAYRERMNI